MKTLCTILSILGLLLLQSCSQEPVAPDQSAQLTPSAIDAVPTGGKPQPPQQVFPSLPVSNVHIAACALHNQQSVSKLLVWNSTGNSAPIWTGKSTSTNMTVGYMAVDLGEINLDGTKELLALAAYTPVSGKRIIQSYGLEVYAAGNLTPTVYPLSGVGGTNNMVRSLEIANVGTNGKVAVVIGAWQTLQIREWEGTNLSLTYTYKVTTPNMTLSSFCVGDPDNDGQLEIVAAAYRDGLVVFEKEGSGWIPHQIPLSNATDDIVDARVCDFGTNGVRHPVIVCCGWNRDIYACEYSTGGSVNWLFSSGDLGAYPMATAAGDFNGTGTVQLAIGMSNPGQTLIYRIINNNGSYLLDQDPDLIATSPIDDMCTWKNAGQAKFAASGSSLYVYNGNNTFLSNYVGQELLHVAAK